MQYSLNQNRKFATVDSAQELNEYKQKIEILKNYKY